ncbi:MAG: hypothetical protein L0Z55_12035 [Planctomycetes bacterium]|nr:hypothetical protein [Planctomycetota bacterium]
MPQRRSIPSGAEIRFLPTDFARFQPELQANPEYNAARLEVRRKLEALGKHLAATLAADDLAFAARASLHHPYKFNRFRVDSQWVYLSRADKERRRLKSLLGVDLGKDLDQNYVHAILVFEIHQHGLEFALRVHKDAWWDGENLKRKCAVAAERESLAACLRPLAGYGMQIHDYRRIHACETITPEELVETLRYYVPGEHWLHISRAVPSSDPLVAAEDFVSRTTEEFRALLPAYRFIRWTPENNWLFEENGAGDAP